MSQITMEQHATIHDFSEEVDKRVEEQYEITDGGDLCYYLVEAGTIDMSRGVDEAARIVAMHLLQA